MGCIYSGCKIMKTLVDMGSPVGAWLSNELDSVSSILSDHLKNKHHEVNDLCNELATYRGKMLRPSLLLLSWRALHPAGHIPNSVRIAAGVVELIHLATLVHDDVLDEADLRRGKQTINSLRGNEAAVMLGDYLLSSAFLLCSTIKNPELNILLGKITNTLCAGEVVQLANRNNVGLTLEQYYQIIHDKTASLIAACCEMGGVLGNGNTEQLKTLRKFGEGVGTAFQIKDDLLDLLERQEDIGKPAGRDLEKGKLTLPIILLLTTNPSLKNGVEEIVANNDRCALRQLVDSSKSVEAAVQKVNSLVEEAVGGLSVVFSNEVSSQMCLMVEQLKV